MRRLSCRVSMTFRVVRTNQYNQDLGLIHSTNGNHLESPNEGSSIDHQVTIYLHAQNITVFPTNETCSCASLSTANCDDITADVIIDDSRSSASCQLLILDFFQSAMLTSSLLLAASSSRHADVIIAESRFLFASIQQLISSFFALLIPDFYCSSSSSTYLQHTS
ncbi:putative disease resistance protein [Dorcoceras hygrometricum]|uniref:Putative disease resistance protein n=1 Tax=Dorcoceras hygrometricum TaxID=472368 RepID=A0A2Z7CUP0_9LAMI|nr:putative disease resistance protein [Dorcoceras hygrometricum]